MGKLYCPYCNPNYQFHKKNSSGISFCGLCGEKLIKKRFITIKKIVSIIAFFSITFPIVLLLILLINNSRNQNSEYYQDMITTKKYKIKKKNL